MQGNYISLVLHKIQCRSLLIYQLLLSSCHTGIFLLEIYGCALAMYHCSYLISWKTQAHLHSSLNCTLLQTTNRRNICLLSEGRAGSKHCSKGERGLLQLPLAGAHREDVWSTRAFWAHKGFTATSHWRAAQEMISLVMLIDMRFQETR